MPGFFTKHHEHLWLHNCLTDTHLEITVRTILNNFIMLKRNYPSTGTFFTAKTGSQPTAEMRIFKPEETV